MAEKILAPLAGKVFKVLISVGEKVEEDDEAIIVEAMKMENALPSPVEGVIKAVNLTPANYLKNGMNLRSLEAIFTRPA